MTLSISIFQNRPLFLVALLIMLLWPKVNATPLYGLKSTLSAIHQIKDALPVEKIIQLSTSAEKIPGNSKVGDVISKLEISPEVLEDTLLRISIFQGKLTRKESESMYTLLIGIPGFASTLTRIIGNTDITISNYIFVLKLANIASRNGFNVLSIAEKISFKLEKRISSIDIILQKQGKLFAIKTVYQAPSKYSLEKYDRQLINLAKYKNKTEKAIIPIISATPHLINPQEIEHLKIETDRHDLELIFGSPQEQIEQITLLGLIL